MRPILLYLVLSATASFGQCKARLLLDKRFVDVTATRTAVRVYTSLSISSDSAFVIGTDMRRIHPHVDVEQGAFTMDSLCVWKDGLRRTYVLDRRSGKQLSDMIGCARVAPVSTAVLPAAMGATSNIPGTGAGDLLIKSGRQRNLSLAFGIVAGAAVGILAAEQPEAAAYVGGALAVVAVGFNIAGNSSQMKAGRLLKAAGN